MNAHRTLLPNTGTKARTPAELPPTNQPARYDKRKAKPLPNGSLPPWGRVGVGAASHPRSNKNNVELSPSLLDSQSATRPAFTYTFPAILYVNVGWGLPHRADATAGTKAQNLAVLLPPLVGESRGGVHPHTALPDSQSATRHAVTVRQGAPYRADVLNMATDELPSALKPLTPPQPSPTGGGSLPVEGRDSGSSINAHNAATIATIPADLPLPCRAKPAAGEGWGGGNARHVITNATSSSALPPPPWGRVGGSPRKMRSHFSWEPGVGAAHDPRSDKFTYTFPATLYVNVGWGLPHRADATAGTTVRTLAVLPPPPVGEGWGGGSKPFAQRQYLTLPKSPFVTRHAVTVRQGAPCRALPVRESRGGVRPHTALPNRQSAPRPAFTYTFPAILYVKGATCHAMP